MKKDHEPALGLITVAALGAAGYAFYTLDTFTAAAIALPSQRGARARARPWWSVDGRGRL